MKLRVLFGCLLLTGSLAAQENLPETSAWTWSYRLDVRGNYRESNHDRFRLSFPFTPEQLPPGASAAWEETVDAGSHGELSLVSLMLDLGYGDLFMARVKIDAVDLYDRNPTSGDRKVDADELWIRFGRRPEGLELPEGTSVFLQLGKAPKFERQPVLLLESYGLASTAFNRFEDTQALAGGSIGRNVYWRAQVSSGNPLFFRDPNALAGDNGIDELRTPNPNPELKSGFPILYDAEVESLFLDTDHLESGGGVGYRWVAEDASSGFDILAFFYQRELAETVELEGTFYGGDLDLLDGVGPHSLAIDGDRKREAGARLHGEWGGLAIVAQYVSQEMAGLERDGWEIEAGYQIPLGFGPQSGGVPLLSWIQPAVRYSELDHHFRGPVTYPAPSVWWDWRKIDAGVQLGLGDRVMVTLEHAFHEIMIPVELDVDETLLSVRYTLR
ncbi:MAG TPA: hypothetical protein VM534_03695 [Thermoanaerobaculia bacterium]|nr:hypothetical protein [Thermoanaerobaculia bacterium]